MSYASELESQVRKVQPKLGSVAFTHRNIGWLTAITDLALISVASVVGGLVYHRVFLQSAGPVLPLLGIAANSGLIFVLLMQLRGLYGTSALMVTRKQIAGAAVNWLLALLLVTAILFLLKIGEAHSRGAMVGFGLLGMVLLSGSRLIISGKLREATALGTLAGPKSLLIGDPEQLSRLRHAGLLRRFGIHEIGRFDLADEVSGDDSLVVEAAIKRAREAGVEQILLAVSWTNERRIARILESLRVLPLPVLLLPDQFVDSVLRMKQEGGSEFLIELQRAPLSRAEATAKRIFDLVLAGAVLFPLTPIFAITSIAILTESGRPVIFRQKRRGFNGREFEILKFRTMRALEDGSKIRQATRNDPRVTRFGRILRGSSIDELPQLFNVLRGDMSLVGPRPHAIAHDDEFTVTIANYAYRHHMKPGITGLAQVRGLRGETPNLSLMESRVELDLWYISNWSFWLDLWILIRTFGAVVLQRNAY
jgi:undecaprenyl-phosphate galactose phosphotransferase/putative colanic acid biosynthesis UDP-glucose lipid carrier transferase